MRLPSPSKLDLAERCAFPFAASVPWDRSESKSARYGKAVHFAIAKALTEWADAAEPYVLKDRGRLALVANDFELVGADRDRFEASVDQALSSLRTIVFPPDAVEKRLWMDPMSISFSDPSDEHRAPGYVEMFLDVAWKQGRTGYVRDWKTGRRSLSYRVEEVLQVAVYGLAMFDTWDLDEVVVELAYLDGAGRVPVIDAMRMDIFAAEAARERIRSIYKRIKSQEALTPRWGHWCESMYCPTRTSCPAMRAATERLAADVGLEAGVLTSPVMDRQVAASLIGRLAGIREILDAREEEINTLALSEPLPMSDGSRYGATEHQGRESIVWSAAAHEALRPLLGPERLSAMVNEATSIDVTKAAVNAAVSSVAKRGEVGKLQDAAIAALRQAGAVKRGSPYKTFGKIKEKKA